MSSSEPFFIAHGFARIAPRSATHAASANAWIPAPVGAVAPRTQPVFESDVTDRTASRDAAARDAATAAAALERQDQIDAAYLRGLNEGREQGEQAERARLRGAMMATDSALDDLRAGEARWLANLEENIAAIAVGVAQQIVTREVLTSNTIVLDIVHRAVQEFGLDHALSIRVNPGDLESLQSAERTSGEDMVGITRGREVRWVSDARIEPGGCVVEGRERIVDGRVDTGLERLYRRMTHTNA